MIARFLVWGASTVDPSTSSILSVIGSLGQTAGVLLSIWIFISYLRSDGEKRDKQYQADNERRDKNYGDLVDRCVGAIADNTASNREFSRSVGTICRLPTGDYDHDRRTARSADRPAGKGRESA